MKLNMIDILKPITRLRAELDAYHASLYGLTRDELRYILDPKESHQEVFTGETFRRSKGKKSRSLWRSSHDKKLSAGSW